ncbi:MULTISPECIES: class II fructose-bisphosphatase [unclassified Romboutsia]|uniref:class II fructose-bisphosphatase n=1 Tax=unclassified Romboutsia TaxID=2626894 RepID=UPI0008220CAC|nr:class II fructose-bisphosphatase [Romboutsia sp. 1001713B170207_170306_H8]SCI37601.1 Fructose-1%2C6-bisphosphatase class 2 [uncultured Clostridium sp.]
MDRNLALELVRVTEAAALVSSKFMGRGDKNGADGAAVEAMRRAFESIKISGEVVIGEGELDEAPMLYIGEKVGLQTDDCKEVDIAVDPLEGTTLIAKGLPNAISVIAMGAKGSLLNAPDTYMKKIIVGPRAKGAIDLNKSAEENIISVANALGKKTSEMTIITQDRERHDYIVQAARKLGARIKVFSDGDVAAGIATCFEDTGIDMLMGIGGGPEGVITAAAVKCMGGDMQGQIYPLSDQEINRCYEMGFSDDDINRVLYIDDLAKGDDLFFAATGITQGDLLKGVTPIGNNKAKTQSVVMRGKTGTIRFVDAIHNLDKNDILVDLMKKYNMD